MFFPESIDTQRHGHEGYEPTHVLRFQPPPSRPQELPSYWDGQSGPLVYATLGTVAGSSEQFLGMYDTMAKALGGIETRALLTTGKALDPTNLGPLPPNVRAERFVPQTDVLPQASAVVCHGGTGTVLGALNAGVPMVVTPLFADQPDNARAVAERGAGLAIEMHHCTEERLREAISRVLDEPEFARAARRIRADFEGLPPASAAPSMLEEIL
jgi:MGT family glycosyltransferase